MIVSQHPNKLLALRLADNGYYVFPCISGGANAKRPLPGVRWRLESTSDIARVEAFWDSAPEAAVGLDVGKMGWLVIDPDRHEGGPDGLEAWKQILASNAASLEDFPTVLTPNGGMHCYFRQPEDQKLGNRRGSLPSGIDVRGDGGYVLAPGTVMADGRKYQCSSGIIVDPPPIPYWLMRLLTASTSTPSRSPINAKPKLDAYAAAGLAYELDAVRNARKGERNNTLYRAACALGQMIGAGWLERHDVEDRLIEAATLLAQDDGELAVRATISSGLDAGVQTPRAAPRQTRTNSNPTRIGDCSTSQVPDPYIDEMNARYALMTKGNTAVVVDFGSEEIEDQLSLKAFHARFECTNVMIEKRNGNGFEGVSQSVAWMRSPRRRNVSGLEFHPLSPGENYDPGDRVNLWRGWSVEPDSAAGSFDTFADHIFSNVANGDAQLAQWIWAFMADLIQRPRAKPGVALVLRGTQGCGKTKVGEVLGSLFPDHHLIVHSDAQLYSDYNAHFSRVLLLQLEETSWTGSQSHRDFLNSFITSDRQILNRKFVDQVQVKNYARILVTSNSDRPVPISKGERRFVILDVNDRCARNAEYFGKMDAELCAGGREALLAHLRSFDLSSIDIRALPRTSASLAAFEQSLDGYDVWWYGRLVEGSITRNAAEWPDTIQTKPLYDDYLATCEERRDQQRLSSQVFGRRLCAAIGQDATRRTSVTIVDCRGNKRRANGYRLPSLQFCRDRFEREAGHPMDWPTSDDARI